MEKFKNEKLAFTWKEDFKGFNIRAYWGEGPDVRIEIIKNGKIYKEFSYPAYKIFNLQAHFEDIVEGELQNSNEGYVIAGSTGLRGVIMPKQ
jgi:hypothetical protein